MTERQDTTTGGGGGPQNPLASASCGRGLSHPYEAWGPAQPTEKEDTGGELCRACFVPQNRRSKTNKNRTIAVLCITCTHLRNDCQDVEELRSGSGVLSLLAPLYCPGWGFAADLLWACCTGAKSGRARSQGVWV